MPRTRGSAITVEAERRSMERRARLGGQVRAMRTRRRWSQTHLGRRAGVDRNAVSRLERGIGTIDVDLLERVGIALEVPLRVEFARDPREDVADAGHLAMQELMLRHARSAGFERQFELATRPSEPWRSIDVAIGSDRQKVAVAEECWNTLGDVGASARQSARKLAELDQAAVARWGEEGRAAPAVFATRFPGSSRA